MTAYPSLEDLLPIALDMTTSLSAEDRSRRLVEAVARVVECDAAAVLRLEGDDLVPVAALGLSSDVFGRRFTRAEHPRLDAICRSEVPVRFSTDSALPDPYDGLVAAAPVLSHRIHACIGCSLRVEGELIGVLTADALEPGAFDQIDDALLAHLAALAGAALRTSDLIEALESRASQQGMVARDLVRDVLDRRGGLLLGASAAMARLRQDIEVVAGSEYPVLITGETGVGKELVVRMLHSNSTRSESPLVYVNCAALPESIVESELFGHEKGAFTGAAEARPGKFRVADGASIFLDEIGELPLHVQPKFLRVLQEGEIQRLGADLPSRVDVRVLAATNRDLEAEVRMNRFRADLLHRLDVYRIRVPPLREHIEDIPMLAGHFADRARRRLGTGPIRFSAEAHEALQSSDWPGNVRELENVVSRGILRSSARTPVGDAVIVGLSDVSLGNRPDSRDLPVSIVERGEPVRPLREATADFQRSLIHEAVRRNHGNWAAAARDLQVDRGNLHHLGRRLGLK